MKVLTIYKNENNIYDITNMGCVIVFTGVISPDYTFLELSRDVINPDNLYVTFIIDDDKRKGGHLYTILNATDSVLDNIK